MKIIVAAALLLVSVDSITAMEKQEGGEDKNEKLIEQIAKVPFKPTYVTVARLSPEERKQRAEESDRRFKELMKIEQGREIAQNICPIVVSTQDNPDLFSHLPDNGPKIKRFYNANNMLFSLEIVNDGAVLINQETGAKITLNEQTEKVFSTHSDQLSNQLLVFKSLKNAEREFGAHTSLVQKINLATGATISQIHAKMPFQINQIAYDADAKRIYLANFMMSCFGGDAASLYSLDETEDATKHVESFSLSNCFYHLFPLKGNKLITVQEEGIVKEWDFSHTDHPSATLWAQPLDSRFESILPGHAIHADLSADEKQLLVATCQPYSRFFLLNLEQAREHARYLTQKRREGIEVEPRTRFSHDILDIDDPRPTTAIKLLPNKTNFLAVRQALKARVPFYLRKDTEDPVDFTVQLWTFSKAMYEKNAPLAEFSVKNSPRKCLELELSPDGTKAIVNNIIWDIALLARAKELCIKDMLKTAQEFDALEGQNVPNVPENCPATDLADPDDEPIYLYPVPGTGPKKQYSAQRALQLLKRLENYYSQSPQEPAGPTKKIDLPDED